ncbi:MAG: hypothetical protein ACPLRZ_02090 [Thermovenabulum sp.]|uniref:hypothetical protein n=1 Tax=Thermovenabulum sp. TaxID=3100335 RepID=UPI003C7A7AAC
MSVISLDFAKPFFYVKYIVDEEEYFVNGKCIVLNLSEEPILINNRPLKFFQSVVVLNTSIFQIKRCFIIEKFADYPDEEALFEEVKKVWPLAYDVTHEERHKGVALWRSPKVKIGDLAVNMCFAGSVPLNVGLHRTHWGGPPIKEVHTQIVGIGKMQQYYEQDLNTLYREEYMAPGSSHIPMYDENCEYPWHQYETVTKGIFMATEILF